MKLVKPLNRPLAAQADGDPSGLAGLECQLSVNTVVARFPSTSRVFNQFGIDLCCGGSLSVDDAAQANGLDADMLCGALREATFT